MDENITMLRFVFLIPFILSIFAMRRKPLFCFRNMAVAGVVFPSVMGAMVLPYAIKQDPFPVDTPSLYIASVHKSLLLYVLALVAFIVSILFLDRKSVSVLRENGLKKETILPIKELIPVHKIFIGIFVFCMLGYTLILATFWHTGHIPYLIDGVGSAKYFQGVTDAYTPFRPFYVLGQQVLAIVNFIILLYIYKQWKNKKTLLLFFPLLLTNIAVLALTLKRGELLFPFQMILGGVFLASKISRANLIYILFLIFVMAYFAITLSPSNNRKPFAGEMRALLSSCFPEKFQYPEEEKSEEAKSKIHSDDGILCAKTILSRVKKIRLIYDAFGIQVRETARLIYNIEHKEMPFYKGKTIIANMISFIPTAYCPFKEKYQLGRVTNRLFGTNPDTAGGPRIGLVGESYLNFGYAGVGVMALLFGAVTWYLDKLYAVIHINCSQKQRIVTASIAFFILSHVVLGCWGDGSSILLTFFVRGGLLILFAVIVLFPFKVGKDFRRLL